MNIALWIAQVLLALTFLGSGVMKLTQPIPRLATNMGWVNDFSEQQVRGIGALEVLGAIGVILPALTGILTWLTPLAAFGLVLTMIGAIIVHARRNEVSSRLSINVILLLLALFVMYGRLVIAPL